MCTGKYVLCLKVSSSCNQSQNNRNNFEFNQDLHNSLLMPRHDFTRITEVENRNAHDVGEYTVIKKIDKAYDINLKIIESPFSTPFYHSIRPFQVHPSDWVLSKDTNQRMGMAGHCRNTRINTDE